MAGSPDRTLRPGLTAIRWLSLPLLAASALACTGTVSQRGLPAGGGDSSGGTGSGGTTGGNGAPLGVDPAVAACAASGGVLNAGLTPARRMTRDQFNNTVRDLLGVTGRPADGLSADERIGPFYSNAIAPVDETLVVQHQEVAAKLALAAKPRMGQLTPCDLAADSGTTCATRFVTEFGRRAYRRPLDATEIQRYVALYTLGKQGDGAANGFRLVVEAMLQSPFFLYLHDVGGTGTPQPGTVALTQHELASRLSYFIWSSMPDDELFAAADAGSLATETMLTAQVRRMVDSPKAAATIAQFHRQWLDVGDLPDQPKDAAVYPGYSAALADAMTAELDMFTDHVVRSGDGLLKTLLTSNMAFPQGPLFSVYGVTQPAGFSPGTPVMLDARQRAGILTQGAFLTRWAHANQTSPVHRGKLVRLNMMCGFVAPPPNNANTTPPAPTAATSTRERFAQHSTDPNCAGCHILMDPIGVGFEHYDAIGAYRDVDGLGAVDARGNISAAGPDLAGAFNGALELATKLAQSSEVANCVANQWFRFSLGRMESGDDACSMKAIHEGFRASGGNIRELLTQIALSAAFRHVRASSGG